MPSDRVIRPGVIDEDLDDLIKVIREDIRLWFSDNNLNKKEMCVSIGNEPWTGENVRIQTRRKR